MSCNSCAKAYSLLRKEKGCPGCGFSYCSNCLKYKIYVEKLNAEAKVCTKCKTQKDNGSKETIQPPDAYFKRLEDHMNVSENTAQLSTSDPNQEIVHRLRNLKEDSRPQPGKSNLEIQERLTKLKSEVKNASESELRERLAKLKGAPFSTSEPKITLPLPDVRTEQEQAEDLMKQYMEQVKMEKKYNSEFESEIGIIEERLRKLRGSSSAAKASQPAVESNSSDDEETVKKVISKLTDEAFFEGKEEKDTDELPFCEICNEDAKMRCLGCRYLFCKRCFVEHKDEDDGCDRYEPFNAKNTQY